MKNITLLCLFIIASLFLVANPNPKSKIVITGQVIAQGDYLSFVNISIKGTTIGTITDDSGHFKLVNIPEGTHTVVASSLGYKSKEIIITVKKGEKQEISFEMEEDAIALDQVVVSSNRDEVSRKEAPVIINTISKKLLESTNSVCLAQSMSFQPGLRVENNCQNCGFKQVRINGLEGQYTQILIDSRAIFSSLSSVYGIEQIPSSMIERVEVMRGGGSALFGSNAIAGTINIITKEPLYNSFQISSNHSLIDKSSLDHSLNINTSIISDDQSSGIFLFGSLRNRGHYDANSDGFSEIGTIENSTFGLRAFYKLSAYSKFIVEYHHLDEFRRGGNGFDLQPHETDITEQTDHDINCGGITYNHFSKNYKSKFSVYTSLQHTKRNSYYGAQQDPDAYGNTSDLAMISGMQFVYYFDKFLFAPSTLTSGFEYQINNLHDEMPGYDRDLKQNIGVAGLFLQNEWKIDKFSILLGARADKHNLIDKTIISPRANLLYKISKNVSYRLTYSKGFRAPQAFDEDLHIAAVGGEVMLINLAENLQVENSNSYSSSFDFTLLTGKIQSSFLIEGFYTQLNDVFVLEEVGTDKQGNKLMERRNGSGAKVYGINTESQIAFSKKYQLQMGFTLQKSEYLQAEPWADNENTSPTRQMLRTPDNYGYFALISNPFKQTSISLSGVYTGKMKVPHYAGYIEQDELKETPNFFELNFKVSQTMKIGKKLQLKLCGGINNILNSYQSDFDKGTFRDAGYIYGPGRPRTFFMGIKIGNNL